MMEFMKLIADNEDDQFFHLTCHIDSATRERIKRGEFIDLERLLPKTRNQMVNEEQKMQFVNKNGATYWVPADKENHITNVRRWEQAFCIYREIYCAANPSRSGEIWQYIYVINSAAAAYAWENVTYYDFTFRQLMAQKPHRSWSKLYNQLWNLAMCDPLLRNNSSSNYVQGGNNQSRRQSGDWKDRCCWRFNKGKKCNKWNCNYDHQCSYCGLWSHDFTVCSKRKAVQGGSGGAGKLNYGNHEDHRKGHDSPKCPSSPGRSGHKKN